MKIYGYSGVLSTGDEPLPLNEISICAEPETLRAIARFFDQVADEMEAHEEFGHSHFRDTWEDWKGGLPDVIVVKPDVGEEV